MSYRMRHLSPLVLLAAFLSPATSQSGASDFTGVVIGMTDSDTLTVTHS